MEQQRMDEGEQERVAAPINRIEEIILAALRMRKVSVGQKVDITQLQEDCLSIGYSPRDLSRGLVGLLLRRYLRPCGEIAFMLTQEGYLAGERAMLAWRAH